MLFGDQGQPLTPGEFLMDSKAEAVDDLTNFLALLLKNSGEDRNSVRLKNAIELLKEVHDEIGRQVAKNQAHRLAFHGIDGPRERPDLVFRIAFDVGMRHLDGDWIDIARDHFLRAEKPRHDCQNSRTCTDVENYLIRLNPALQRLDRELCRLVRPRAKCLAGINADG